MRVACVGTAHFRIVTLDLEAPDGASNVLFLPLAVAAGKLSLGIWSHISLEAAQDHDDKDNPPVLHLRREEIKKERKDINNLLF